MKTSWRGIELIKKYEGFKGYLYCCPAGKPTIGYGHVLNPKEIELTKVKPIITKEEAEKLLLNDIKNSEIGINNSVKVDLMQGQFDALVSLGYNYGMYAFKTTKGLRLLNEKKYKEAAIQFFSKEFGVVRVGGRVFEGLVVRRQAEWDLWND